MRRRVQSDSRTEYIFQRFHPRRFDIRLAGRQIRKDPGRHRLQFVGIHRWPLNHIHPHVLAILRVQVHRRRLLRQHLRVRLHIGPGIRGTRLAHVRRPRLVRPVLHVRGNMHALDGVLHSGLENVRSSYHRTPPLGPHNPVIHSGERQVYTRFYKLQ